MSIETKGYGTFYLKQKKKWDKKKTLKKIIKNNLLSGGGVKKLWFLCVFFRPWFLYENETEKNNEALDW